MLSIVGLWWIIYFGRFGKAVCPEASAKIGHYAHPPDFWIDLETNFNLRNIQWAITCWTIFLKQENYSVMIGGRSGKW
jgi:hypothetical protein